MHYLENINWDLQKRIYKIYIQKWSIVCACHSTCVLIWVQLFWIWVVVVSLPKEALASTHPQAWTVHHLGNLPVSRPAIEKWVALNPLSATLFVPPIFSHIHTITHFPFGHHLHHPSYLSPYPYLHISIPTKLTSHTSFPTIRSLLFCFLSYPAVKMF